MAIVLDLYSRKAIGWSMDKNIDQDLVNRAFKMAAISRKPTGNLISHTDRGSQYASKRHQKLLKLFSATCSMSRKGNCWDSAVVESFFKSLKYEHTEHCDFETRIEAKRVSLNGSSAITNVKGYILRLDI